MKKSFNMPNVLLIIVVAIKLNNRKQTVYLNSDIFRELGSTELLTSRLVARLLGDVVLENQNHTTLPYYVTNDVDENIAANWFSIPWAASQTS